MAAEPLRDQIKNQGRDARLTWSKRAEQKLREELHEIALAKCDNIIRDFVDCSKASGILVVFKCREQNKNMNDCLTSYKNAEAFERYRSMREAELVGDS